MLFRSDRSARRPEHGYLVKGYGEPQRQCCAEYRVLSDAEPLDEPYGKEVERGRCQINREPAGTDPRVIIVDCQQPEVGAARRYNDRQQDDRQPPLQRGPDQVVGGLFEDRRPAPRPDRKSVV